jgi:mannitol-specific phosphotransferase system IIBC component
MPASIPATDVKLIVFACEAGMGSSLMGVNALKKKIKQAGLNVDVVHKAVRSIPADTRLVVTHKGLASQARGKAPQAVVVSFSSFLNDPVFDKLVASLKAGEPIVEA